MDKSVERPAFWYPVRVTEGDCQDLTRYLDSVHLPNYFNAGAFHNICFIRTTQPRLEQLKADLDGKFSMHCLWDGVKFGPASIPDKTMQDFMKVAESHDGSPLYLETVSSLLKDCRRVRVTSGKFSGIEGKLVRIKKTRRVMIDLPGDIAVATEYIRPECMEVIG